MHNKRKVFPCLMGPSDACTRRRWPVHAPAPRLRCSLNSDLHCSFIVCLKFTELCISCYFTFLTKLPLIFAFSFRQALKLLIPQTALSRAEKAVKASLVVIKKLHADFKFLDGNPEKPVLFVGKWLSTTKIVSILFNSGPGILSTKQPLKVKKECCFLVDLRRVSLDDLRADGNPPYDRCEFVILYLFHLDKSVFHVHTPV